jgi:alkylation response protein AidB-like acyl-CoA dehydrogenase
VDFELSEDQLALRKAAEDLLTAMAPTSRVRQVGDDADHFDRSLWAAMSEQGWTAIELPADDGGLGLGAVEVSVLCEALGRHLAPAPYLGTVLCAGVVQRARAEDHGGAEWIERLAGGDAVGALSWPARADALVAERHDGGWQISGRSDPVVFGPVADVVVTPAATAEGPALFLLHPSKPAPEPAMDRTRSLGRLDLRGETATRLGGAEAVDDLLDRAATAQCAEMLGAAGRVLELSVEYAKDRVQFGRPIGSFQAVKHRCADMLVDVEGMRSAAYYAAWAVGAGDPDAPAAASAAKVWCSDASRRVMASGLQVHGGIGFTWEHDLHLYVKRAQLDQISFGDARFHRDRIAAILRPRAEAGLPVL